MDHVFLRLISMSNLPLGSLRACACPEPSWPTRGHGAQETQVAAGTM